MQKMAFKL